MKGKGFRVLISSQMSRISDILDCASSSNHFFWLCPLPLILGLKYQTPAFHRLCSALDETTLIHDLCIAGLTATTEGSRPYGLRFLGPSTVYICFHDRIKGHLRRHLFEQVVEHSRAGDVSAARDQSDGARDVSIPRLGAQRRTVDVERVRRYGT